MQSNRIAVYGSCVSRDALEFRTAPSVTIGPYVARQSLISAFWPEFRQNCAAQRQHSAVHPQNRAGQRTSAQGSSILSKTTGVAGLQRLRADTQNAPSVEKTTKKQEQTGALAAPTLTVDPSALSSAFQRRVLTGDVEHNLTQVLGKQAGIDLLLWDLVDERSGYFVLPDGNVLTDTVELRHSGFVNRYGDQIRHVPFGSTEYMQTFRQALSLYKEFLTQVGLLERSLFVMAPLATLPNDPRVLPDAQNFMVKRRGEFLENTFQQLRRMVQQAGFPTLDVPRNLVLFDANHRWGPAPYHYASGYYRYVCGAVEQRLGVGAHLTTGNTGQRVRLTQPYQVMPDTPLRVHLDVTATALRLNGRFADDGTLPVKRMLATVKFRDPLKHAPQGATLDSKNPRICSFFVPIDGFIDIVLWWGQPQHVVDVRLESDATEAPHRLTQFNVDLFGGVKWSPATLLLAHVSDTVGKAAFELRRHPRLRRLVRRLRPVRPNPTGGVARRH